VQPDQGRLPRDPSLDEFRRAVLGPDAGIDLARVALLIARAEYPTLDVAGYLHRLDQLADKGGAGALQRDPLRRLHRLREFLFEEVGFRGNADEYFDPRNSFLNDVLDRRLGIPITLSLVMIEVGRRLGLEIQGIGLPAHFIVGAEIEGCQVLLDPFQGGTLLTRESAQELVSRVLSRPVTLQDGHFAPVSKRQFIRRMLANLKGIYCRRECWAKALPIMERLLTVAPDSPEEVRDRGSVLVNLGALADGIADFERYLTLRPEAPDAEPVRQHLRRARTRLAALN
jgi:regulator of sirC expression with transglutaminase-like and TPR domain